MPEQRPVPHPGVVDDPAAFDAFLSTLAPAVRSTVTAVDALVRAEDPEVVQVLWAHQRTVGYGVGRRKATEHYAYLDVYDRHVNLGFNRGALLPDEHGLLSGTGAAFRRMRLDGPAAVAAPGVRELLVAARAERLAALGRS